MSSKVLAGRYELLEKIGDGGMAVVYRAMDKLLNRLVAIKILKPQFTEDEKFIDNFRKESHAAASLSHPNIVGVYDVGKEGNINYIVMELVRGKPLSEIIHEEGPLDTQRTVDFARQIASGLSAAHKQGIIHRDVKPHNILVNEDGIAKIADFGIAKAVSVSTIVDATGENNIIGSVHYFSPEQARGGYVDARSDIYSLGIVMYEMATGQVPFDGDNPVSVALMQINNPITPPSEFVDMPPALEKIILKATDKLQMNRYQSAEELIDALDEMDLVGRVVGSGAASALASHTNFANQERRAREIEELEGLAEDYEEEEGGINKKRLAMILGIGGAVLVILLIAALATGLFSRGKVEVPDVRGMTYLQAEKELAKHDLKIKEGDLVYSEEYEVGEVVSQDPEQGDKVKKGSTVVVNLSKGKTEGTVPNLVGLPLDDAKKLIEKYDFEVGDVVEKTSDQPAGTVLEQDPKAGSESKTKARINLVVSDGKGKKQVTVPDLKGKTKSEAEAELKKVGLELGSIGYDVSSKYNKDVIMGQSIDPGTQVDEGSSVNIVISQGASGTINYNVDFSLADSEVFYLTITVTDANGTRNVVSNQQCQRSSGNQTFAIKGTGTGTIVVTFDNKTVYTHSVDFSTGELS